MYTLFVTLLVLTLLLPLCGMALRGYQSGGAPSSTNEQLHALLDSMNASFDLQADEFDREERRERREMRKRARAEVLARGELVLEKPVREKTIEPNSANRSDSPPASESQLAQKETASTAPPLSLEAPHPKKIPGLGRLPAKRRREFEAFRREQESKFAASEASQQPSQPSSSSQGNAAITAESSIHASRGSLAPWPRLPEPPKTAPLRIAATAFAALLFRPLVLAARFCFSLFRRSA